MSTQPLLLDAAESKFIQTAPVPPESECFPCETAYIGVDPGLSGALAVIWPDGPLWVYDVEEIRVARKKRDKATGEMKEGSRGYFNDPAAAAAVREIRQIANRREWNLTAAIESIYAQPGKSFGSALTIGENAGIWRGIFATLSIPYRKVPASAWKNKMLFGLPSEKGSSILGALQLFPTAHTFLKLNKHDGRAEALLIAAYLRKKENE